jgi:hypothetical protein
MNKIKRLTVAGSLVMASSLLAPSVANAQIFSSGSSCMAANLTQALAGIGWSQAGVVNNSTTPFFVVCPLETFELIFPIGVTALGTFPAGGGTIECTFRTQDVVTGTYLSTAFTITGGVPAGFPPNRGVGEAPFTLAGPHNTMVCALDPGEGIEVYTLDF